MQRIRNLPKGVKASIAFFVSSLLTKGIAYLTTPFYTRLLTTAEYGQVSVYLTWVQIFGIVAMFSFMNGVFNNGMVDFPNKRDEFSFSLLILSNIITICFTILVFLLFPIINSLLRIDFPLMILMIVVFLFQPAQSFWLARQRYEYKYKLPLIVSVSSSLFSSISAVLCLLLIHQNGVYERLFGAELVLIGFYIFFYFLLGIKNKWAINVKYWKYAFFFNLPLIPHYLSTYLLSSSDKIMISRLVGDAEAGIYSIAVSIASIALIIWTAINGSLIPFTYEKCKSKNFEDISKITSPLLLLFAVGCVIVILLAPEAVKLISTNDYLDAIYIIPPIVGGVFFQVQYYMYANIIYFYKKPVYVMVASFAAMLLNIVLNYVFITKIGYFAAGYTTIISYGVQVLLDYVAMKRIVKCSVYNMRFIAVLSFAVIVFALLSNFIYPYAYLRYGIILAILVGIIIFRKRISSLFVSLKKKEGETNVG